MTQYIQTEGGTQIGKPWTGSPVSCDLCTKPEPTCFVDGQLIPSPANHFHSGWAIMCIPCFKTQGKGLGHGVGQKYCKKE